MFNIRKHASNKTRCAKVNISIHRRDRLRLDKSLRVLERGLLTLADRLDAGSHGQLVAINWQERLETKLLRTPKDPTCLTAKTNAETEKQST